MLRFGLAAKVRGIVHLAESCRDCEQYRKYAYHNLKDFTILQDITPPFLYDYDSRIYN